MQKTHLREKVSVLPLQAGAIRAILDRTAGLWKKRRLSPLTYQRQLRRQYETIRAKETR